MTRQQSDRDEESYRSPFLTRWSSAEMLRTWSDLRRARTWRSLWIALAEGQKTLGLDISEEALRQLREQRDDVDLEAVQRYESELRHDVMAHIHAYGDQCPAARGIIHLGATSCFVTDNADLILMREGLRLLIAPLAQTCRQLAAFARRHKDLPCLGYTHFQPAQLTTVGKRACLWLQDFMADLGAVADLAEGLPFRGVKGATGTQASFLALFDGDGGKVEELERAVAEKMGFERSVPVTGQTYPRKLDFQVLTTLSGVAVSASKMAADIRLLAGLKEIEEPFGARQVGSSAMAYKRNPMRCERMAALSRFLITNAQNAAFTAADQWLERTLDDSANRRLSLAEGFLAADSIVRLAQNITDGLVVHAGVIAARVRAELPFLATESILMAAVKAGGDRQRLHERIRRHAMAAAERIKSKGAENDLLERIAGDEAFSAIRDGLEGLLQPEAFVGRAPQQVEQYLARHVEPALERFRKSGEGPGQLRV